ncbi:MAG: succinoglycan biosynthesis protein exoa [Candidatus Binatia bacterium]|nr:MAG: succinoglycan biosynthesis protein exoa [Candidatus Binatia bacterium]
MSDWPFISVVIPMRNEGRHIARCLDSILAQDYPSDRFEVIVVDGDSDDNSRDVLARYGERIRVLRNPARIVPTALNIGIRAARGDIIARVDAHTVLEPDYLREGVRTLRQTGADNVGGPMRTAGGGPTAEAIARAMDSPFGIGAYFHFAQADREVDTVYMGMWPRSTFERVGLFDEELVRNQDDELNYRIRKAGGKVYLTVAMRSLYQNRESYRALARQFFEYGKWKVRVLQKHPRQMSWRHFVPPSFVAATLASMCAAAVWPPAIASAVALLGVYGVAVAAAAGRVARKHRIGLWPRIAWAFVIMHWSWGLGFLSGLVRFAHRWLREENQPPQLAPRPQLAAARS